MSMRCELEANYIGLLEPGNVEVSDKQVRCWCGFLYIARNDEAAHGFLPTDLQANCSMVITRCPMIH